jgi:glycosyltransferase involved in cell wall biosynthesis
MNKKMMVSVVMITYGHEQFITEAVEGVLMQKCDFEIELIIANDCSPDNTDIKIDQIINNHPNSSCIKYTKHTFNKGMMDNFIWALLQAKSKYIALCDGDDSWTDPLKLQKQYEIMEMNAEIVISTHNARVVRKDIAKSNNYVHEKMKGENKFIDLLESCSFPTSSFFFRNNLLSIEEINILNKSIVGDWLLILLLLRHGNLHYSNDICSIYNVHDKNVWANDSRTKQIEGKIKIYEYIVEHLYLNAEENNLASISIRNEKILLIKEKILSLNLSFYKELFFLFASKEILSSLIPLFKHFIPSNLKSKFKSF